MQVCYIEVLFHTCTRNFGQAEEYNLYRGLCYVEVR